MARPQVTRAASVWDCSRLPGTETGRVYLVEEIVQPYSTRPPVRPTSTGGHGRVAVAQPSDAVLVSLEGRSAYDSLSLLARSFLAPEPLRFTHMFYGRPSAYSCWDNKPWLTTAASGPTPTRHS